MTLVSGSADKAIKVWNMETGSLLHTLEGHSDWVKSVCLSPDGKTIVSGGEGYDKSIKVWDMQTGQVLSTLEGHSDSVGCVGFSPDGQTVVSGSFDKTIKVWGLR